MAAVAGSAAPGAHVSMRPEVQGRMLGVAEAATAARVAGLGQGGVRRRRPLWHACSGLGRFGGVRCGGAAAGRPTAAGLRWGGMPGADRGRRGGRRHADGAGVLVCRPGGSAGRLGSRRAVCRCGRCLPHGCSVRSLHVPAVLFGPHAGGACRRVWPSRREAAVCSGGGSAVSPGAAGRGRPGRRRACRCGCDGRVSAVPAAGSARWPHDMDGAGVCSAVVCGGVGGCLAGLRRSPARSRHGFRCGRRAGCGTALVAAG